MLNICILDSYVLVKSSLNEVHKHSFGNKEEILRSVVCACFYCRKGFGSDLVVEWGVQTWQSRPVLKDATRPKDTAKCPNCGHMTVLGDACGYDLTHSLVRELHEFRKERLMFPFDFDYTWFQPVKV